MDTNVGMVAYCGLYCGACSFKLAVDDAERAHVLSLPTRYDKAKEAELEACPGCRGESAANGDDPCEIRSCARARGLAHCGLCADFPCDCIALFAGDGAPHHADTVANLRRLNEVGAAAWLAEQEARWMCSCGARRSWYLRECPKCGSALAHM